MASEHKNSLIEDLKTALPSPSLEYGVRPEPFSCSSHLSPFLEMSVNALHLNKE